MTAQKAALHLKLSIIIPTRNRAGMLRDTLNSLPAACVGQEEAVECLVIDNGSTDDTRAVVADFVATASFPVRYIYEPCPGLHVGRNLGAQLASAEILAYLDDDVYVEPGWAEALISRFKSDEAIALVGGPCRPAWEAPVPAWVEGFKKEHAGGYYYAGLSLIDLGDTPKPVTFDCIFGCNFVVRKSVLLKAGGFHPDGMPPSLIRFRGDGEDAVAKYIEASGLTVYYEPRAAIRHRVPRERLTKEYLLGVGRRSGISIGYTQHRAARSRGLSASMRQALKHVWFLVISYTKYLKMYLNARTTDEQLYELCMLTAQRAAAKHFLRISLSPALARWVAQPSYFEADPCPYWQKR